MNIEHQRSAFQRAYVKTDYYKIHYEKNNAFNSVFFWNKEANHYTWHDVNSAWEMWLAAQQQQGIKKLQAEIDELKRKYDAMYNAFVVANDCRKEWHGCFTRAKEEKDRLQSMINQTISYMDSGCSGSLSPMLKIRRILKGE